FDSVSGIDHVDYEMEYNKSSYYQPVVGAISLEQTINDSNLTLIATNTGTVNAQFVEAYALFFDAEGNVVSYASSYITDDDSELKPGAALSAQLDSYSDFDHVECYLTGRSDGSASEAPDSAISDSDFDIKEYAYEDSIGSTTYYLIIKNNSDETVKISGNATAYDSLENVIGAGDCSVDVLGPGEETIAYFFFDFVSGLDHIDYKLNYSESDYFEPVINELSMEQNINDNNVVVTVTNNGTEAAEFVEVYALFFDQHNNIVGTSSAYAIDDDSELKPGESISKQLDIYDSFDHVECYLTGRRYK
nr:FxLYD domain-containing protein [Lachnospiraceae bacterium]